MQTTPSSSENSSSFDPIGPVDITTDNSSPDSSPATVEAPATGQAVAKATLGISALYLVRFVVGFVAQPLIAHNFGLRWQADSYAVSTDIVQRLWLVFEKVINPAFLPNFIAALKEEGEERAWQLASTAIWLIAAALLVVTPLAYWGMPSLVHLLSQKAGPEQIELTIHTARVLLLGLFFLGMSSLTYTILNGYKRFVYAALGDMLWKVGILCGAVAARLTHAPPEKALKLIVVGFLVGSVLKLLPHVLAIGSKWQLLKPRIDLSDPLVRKMFALAVPLILGIVVSETRGFYLQYLADDPSIKIDASRAALKWSRIIGDNLIQIFPYALSIGIFPYLADLARDRDRQPLTDTLVSSLRICIFFFAPITAILIALRLPLLRAVWESGRLTQSDTIAMSAPFVAFTLGLIGFACEMMLNQAFYAMTRAWTPTLIGVATTVLWIAVAKYGVETQHWGLAAIAGAESLSKTVKCLAMWQMLKPHLGSINRRQNGLFCLKVLMGSILAAFFAAFVIGFISPGDGASHFKLKMLLAVTLSGLGGLVAFLVVSGFFRVPEVRYIGNAGTKIRAKLKSR